MSDFKTEIQNGLTLIYPSKKTAMSNSVWTKDNLWLRSRIEDGYGNTVSQGFGKFFNLGQGNNDLRTTTQEIVEHLDANLPVIATLKHDGSCLIRSVYQGKVIYRTRGSFNYTFHENAEGELAQFIAKYPLLDDPNWCNNQSLLFEWVTPKSQIIVQYNQPDLYLIGGIDHGHNHISHLRYLKMSELEELSNQSLIPLVEYFVISTKTQWYEFYHNTLNDKNIEGFVIRLNEEQELVKIKADSYIAKHSLKYSMTLAKLIDMWLENKSTINGLLAQLAREYDEEVAIWALPYIEKLESAIKAFEDLLINVRQDIQLYHNQQADRKTFAIAMSKKYGGKSLTFALGMVLWSDVMQEPPQNLVRKFMIEYGKDEVAKSSTNI